MPLPGRRRRPDPDWIAGVAVIRASDRGHDVSGSDPNPWDHVLDLEMPLVTQAHAVAAALRGELHRHPLDAEVLSDQRREGRHRPAERPAEHAGQLVRLLVARRFVDQDAEPPCSIAFMRRCSSSSGTSSVCVAMVQVYPMGSLSVALRSP